MSIGRVFHSRWKDDLAVCACIALNLHILFRTFWCRWNWFKARLQQVRQRDLSDSVHQDPAVNSLLE